MKTRGSTGTGVKKKKDGFRGSERKQKTNEQNTSFTNTSRINVKDEKAKRRFSQCLQGRTKGRGNGDVQPCEKGGQIPPECLCSGEGRRKRVQDVETDERGGKEGGEKTGWGEKPNP